jgi:hypothetical protein
MRDMTANIIAFYKRADTISNNSSLHKLHFSLSVHPSSGRTKALCGKICWLNSNTKWEIFSIGDVGNLIASRDPNICKSCAQHILTDVVPELNLKALTKGQGIKKIEQ